MFKANQVELARPNNRLSRPVSVPRSHDAHRREDGQPSAVSFKAIFILQWPCSVSAAVTLRVDMPRYGQSTHDNTNPSASCQCIARCKLLFLPMYTRYDTCNRAGMTVTGI